MADDQSSEKTEVAVLAGGCFWCTEAVFLRLRGVQRVMPGYTGGSVPNPTYAQVCTGLTGHAEAVRIEFDPQQISYEQILDVHFHTHDPTTLNRQGADEGTQYRSAVFWATEEQKAAAEQMIARLNASGEFRRPVVTTLEKLGPFYPAEDYHRNYFARNPQERYCQLVISPKVSKFRERYRKLLKSAD